MSGSLGSERKYSHQQREDIKIAEQLGYNREVIRKLQNEPNDIRRKKHFNAGST